MTALSPCSPSDPCPSARELQSFAVGRLPAEEHERLAGHVEFCTGCLSALGTLGSRADSLLADVRRAAVLDLPLGETRPPATLAGYEIVRELGRGGMGIVYLARQPLADRLVALKQIHPAALAGLTAPERQQVLERFRSEARAASRLAHDNLVPVFEVGEADGQPFYTMRYLEGGSLHAVLRDSGPLPARPAAAHVEAAARAVQHAHEQGVLHRDLKPHNILLGSDGRPHVADFGLAKRLDGSDGPTLSGRALGTLGYAAPEQVRDARRAGVASDVYGLGATLYALLTGRPPFQAASDAEVLDHVRWHDAVPPRQLNPSVPLDLDTICLKCLHKEPTRRYVSAGDLADDLSRFLAGEPVRARRTGAASRLARWCRRQPALAAALAAAFAGLATAAVVAALFAVEKARVADERDAEARRMAQLVRDRQQYAELSFELADTSLQTALATSHWQNGFRRPDALAALLRLDRQSLPAALESLDGALDRLDALAAGTEEVDRRRRLLGYYCSVLGQRAQADGRREDAERILRLAVTLWEQRRQTDPADADAANELANCLYFQGVLARDQGRGDDQEATWTRAAAVSEDIAGRGPEYAANLGRTCYNLGVLAGQRGRPDEVLRWQTKAVEALEPIGRALPARTDLAWFLGEAYVGRGVAWHDRKDDARAASDLKRAAELATGRRREDILKFVKGLAGQEK